LFEIKKDGEIEWIKNYGSFNTCSFIDANDKYILSGQFNRNLYITCIDLYGNEVWNREYQIGKYYGTKGNSIRKSTNNNFIIAGRTGFNKEGWGHYEDCDMLLTKINNEGDTLWTRSINTDNYTEYGLSIATTSDNGYIIGGETGNTDCSGCNPIFLVRTDEKGNH
jgi:hypothetical protein